ncbi:hypothetical protein JMJ77_0006915, partial [Colletotrichum scovillei]
GKVGKQHVRSRSGQGEGKWDSGARAFFPDSLHGRPERLPKASVGT